MRVALVVGLGVAAGCGRLWFDAGGDDARAPDATPFSAPALIPGISVAGEIDEDCAMTGDRLELYFTSTRFGAGQILRATRTSVTDPWSLPEAVVVLGSPDWDATPEPSSDGLMMWFASNRLPAQGTDIFTTTRASRSVEWSAPVLEDALYVADTFEYGPAPVDPGLTLVFGSDRTGNYDLYMTTRAAIGEVWAAPQPIAELDTAADETDPFLTGDGLTLYYTSQATGHREIVVARRASTSEPFGAAVAIDELNTPAEEQDIWVSPDGRYAIFASNRSGDYDLYEVAR